jgi:hypothetical protein
LSSLSAKRLRETQIFIMNITHLHTRTTCLLPAALAIALLAGISAPGAQKGSEKKNGAKRPVVGQQARREPLKIVRPAELAEKNMSGDYRFFLGSPHSHSVYSGDHAKTVATNYNKGIKTYDIHTPAQCYATAKTNFYDFYFVTDHSSPEQNDFYRDGMTDAHWEATRQQALAASTPAFLAMRGYEFSRNNDKENGGTGHMNVLNSSGWNSAYAPGHTFAWLYDWMGKQTNDLLVAQFNHPPMPGTKGKNFRNFEGRTKAANEVVRLAEIWNSGEGLHFVPVVKKIWSVGWKVAPTAGSDLHGPVGMENRRIRTGVLAENLTTDSMMRAFRARRVYATIEPALHLEFTLNGHMMGSELEHAPEGDLKTRVFANDPGGAVLSKVEIWGGKYDKNGGGHEVAATLPLRGGSKIVEGTVPAGHDFYYAVVYKEGIETPRAFSAPVWLDNY